MIGLYDGAVLGAGFTSMTFSLSVNGTSVIAPATFTSAAAAKAYFTDHAFNFGALPASSSIPIVATMSITSASAGSGFYGAIIVGDPPPAGGATRMAQAMAAMPASAASPPSPMRDPERLAAPTLVLPRLASWA